MKYLLLILFLFSSTALFADESVDRSLKARPDGKVVIEIVKGDVTIIGWNKSEVRVQGEHADDDQFIFESDGDTTFIQLEPEGDHGNHHWGAGSAEFTISVPSKSSIEAGGMSTEFVIKEIEGAVRAESVSGDIELTNIIGNMNIETVSGEIEVEASKGNMRLSSVSGDIETKGASRSLDLNTVSGDVEADVGEVDLVDFTSVSGDLELNLSLARQGQIEANTVSGNMNLNFNNSDFDVRFDLETGPGGEIDNRLSDDKARESFIGSEKLSFTIGKGRSTIELETMSGTIELTKE